VVGMRILHDDRRNVDSVLVLKHNDKRTYDIERAWRSAGLSCGRCDRAPAESAQFCTYVICTGGSAC
jgi:hypothetical protein